MEKKNNIRKYRQGTKAAVYAAYGIEYKAGKIFSPVFGWIAPLLKNGNHKIGAGVYHFSTMPTNAEFSAIGEKTSAILAAADLPAYAMEAIESIIKIWLDAGFVTD